MVNVFSPLQTNHQAIKELACVASVSVEQRVKKRGFREKWGESKNKKEGVGEGKEKEGLDRKFRISRAQGLQTRLECLMTA